MKSSPFYATPLPLSLLASLLVLAIGANATAGEIGMGSTQRQVVDQLGPPDMKTEQNGRLVYFYAGGAVEFHRDKVVGIDGDLFDRVEQRAKEEAEEQAQLAKGLVKYEGRWMTPDEANQLRAEKLAAEQRQVRVPYAVQKAARDQKRAERRAAELQKQAKESVQVISNGGKKIDLKKLKKKNMVTVIDFYADWCGPCKQMSPYLVQLAASNKDVYLVKVDIVDFESAVAKQFRLTSIPHMRVFGRDGGMVGHPTHDPTKVSQFVEDAL